MRAWWTALLLVAVGVAVGAAPESAATWARLQTAAAVQVVPHRLALNGTTAYADVADAPDLDLTGDWTIELWFKDESREGYFHLPRVLLTKGNPLVDRQVPYGLVIGFSVLAVGERSGDGGRLLTYNLAQHGVSANAWHHVAATMQATTGTLSLFLDGVEVAHRSGPVGRRLGNNRPLRIGRDGSSGFFWRGKLDDVRVWNVVRTDDQIRTSYQQQLTGLQAGLVANWQFDETGGALAHDSAGAHVAQLFAGATFSPDVPVTILATPTPTSASAATATPTTTSTATASPTAT